MDNETLIIILFFITNILTAICLGLLDSRNFWRDKWKKEIESDKNG